jgi:murein DD-endopeptidase MepM/ murein hydrolase activator NlpD
MSFRSKKIVVRLTLAVLHILVVAKRQLVFVSRYVGSAIRFFLRFIGGRRLALVIARFAHILDTRELKPTMRSSTIGLLLFVTMIAVLYRTVAPSAGASATPPLAAGETVEGIIEEYTGIGGPDRSMLGTLEVFALPPGVVDIDDSAIAITGEGNALAASASPITQLEHRLREEAEEYIVQEGDNVGSIAARFGISTNTILWENKLTSRTLIRPGQTLIILPTSGLSHIVKRGETLASIAKRYKVEQEEVLQFNELADASSIAVGTKLIVPEGTPPIVRVAAAPRSPSAPSQPPPGVIASGAGMIPPATGYRITQYYSFRHSGIDVGLKNGSAVVASDDGVVARAGWGTGYGNYVLVDHGNGLVTRYAHNSKNYVSAGDRVSRGQTIAAVGSTGWSTGPHIHFEIIQNGRFVNPTKYVKF